MKGRKEEREEWREEGKGKERKEGGQRECKIGQ
jgi:hypothetical protein